MLAAAACVDDPAPARFGLPAVHLQIDTDDLARMRSGTYTGTGVPADVYIEGEHHVAEVSFAGASSVDDVKKNINLDLDAAVGRRYRLNAMSRDPSALRAVLAFRAHGLMGLETIDPIHVAVFVNDDYAGLYLLHEVIDPELVAARGRHPVSIYRARKTLADLESTANLPVAFSSEVGTETYADLEKMVARVHDVTRLDPMVVVDDVLRYMAVAAFTDSRDGIDNNYVLIRTRAEPRFTIWPWDVDYTFHPYGTGCDGALLERNALMRRLLDEPDSRDQYDDYLDQLDARDNRQILIDLLESRAAAIAEAYQLDPYLGRFDPPPHARVAQIRALLSKPRCD